MVHPREGDKGEGHGDFFFLFTETISGSIFWLIALVVYVRRL